MSSSSTLNMNEISIPMLRHGCFQCQFDETYPPALNGILTLEQFHQSIESINVVSRLSSIQKLSVIIPIGILLVGLTLSVVGGIVEETSHEKRYFVLVACGVLMLIGGCLFYLFVYLKINSTRSNRIKQQITVESKKHLDRSGKTLQWTLLQISSTSKSNRDEHFNFLDDQFEIVIAIDSNDLPTYEKISSTFVQVNEREDIPPPLYSDLYQ